MSNFEPFLRRTLIHRASIAAVAAALTLFAAGCDDGGTDGDTTTGGTGGGTGDACAELEAALGQALDQAHAGSNSPGAVLAVSTPDCGLWTGAAGESTPGEPLRPDHVLRIGSVTKTFVSSALLEHAREGAFGLDDPLSTWLPTFPNADGITVRQVLNHSSGIFNYTEDDAWVQAVLADPDKAWTPQELVDVAAAQQPYFEPGLGWHYSNTNYIIAGIVLQAVSGKGVAEVLRERLLDPQGLTGTSLDGEEPIAGELAHGYTTGMQDVTHALHPSAPWAAGAMVASAGDVARWAGALYGGTAIDPSSLAEMLANPVETGQAGVSYGLGVILYDTPAVPLPMVGHGGGIPGFSTSMLYLTGQQSAVVAIVNTDTVDPNVIAGAAIEVLLARQ